VPPSSFDPPGSPGLWRLFTFKEEGTYQETVSALEVQEDGTTRLSTVRQFPAMSVDEFLEELKTRLRISYKISKIQTSTLWQKYGDLCRIMKAEPLPFGKKSIPCSTTRRWAPLTVTTWPESSAANLSIK